MRATFFNTEKYGVDEAAPYFEDVAIKLTVESPAKPEHVRALVRHAERACHAAQSFRHPIPVSLAARLNGEALEVDEES